MTARGPGGHDDHHLPEQFLVDGVAPSVIGDGPPESPFDVAPDPEPPARHRQEPRRPIPRGTGYDGGQPGYHPIEQEPPTSPIPAQSAEPEKRRSWLGRMFRG